MAPTQSIRRGGPHRQDSRYVRSGRFQLDLLQELVGASGLDPELVNERIRKAFLGLTKAFEPTLVLEVGAHEASFSRVVKERLPDCRVVAFEANPYVFERYRDRVRATGVDYVHQAASDEAGTVSINVPREIRGRDRPLHNRMASLHQHRLSGDQQVEEVTAVRLDDEFPAPDERIVAWVDVEGANEQVLLGGERLFGRALAVYIETESRPMWEGQWLDVDVLDFFEARGFSLVMVDAQRLHQHNLVFVRTDLAGRPRVVRAAARVYRPVGPAAPQPATPWSARRVLRGIRRRVRALLRRTR